MRSAFGDLVVKLCKERGISPRALAMATGAATDSLMTYYLRTAAPGRKAILPPLDVVERWADHLGLHGEERAAFIRAGALEHCPAVIREYVKELEARVATVAARRVSRKR